MTEADPFVGKFKLQKSENFDEFLSQLGVGYVMRKLAQTASPTIEVTKQGEKGYTIKTTTTFKTTELKFVLDEEFEETRMDGTKVKTTITRDGNKLIQIQDGDKKVEIIREVEGDTMTTICKVNNVVSTRVYKRVPAA